MTFAFSEVKVDQSNTHTSDYENTFGNIFLGILYFSTWVNFVYIIPTKLYEIYLIIKKFVLWLKSKLNIKEKIVNEANYSKKNISRLPQKFTSQITDNKCFIEVTPKRKQFYFEREWKNEQEDHKIKPYNWEFLKKYETHKENYKPRSKRKIDNCF